MGNDSNSIYEVKSGDTFSKIAKKFGLTIAELTQANPGIKNIDKIQLKQKIVIPGGQPAQPSQPSQPATPTPTGPAPAGSGMTDTKGLSADERYAFYAPILSDQGIDVDGLAAGVRVILGLRRTTSTKANAGKGVYDDRVVVAWRDGEDGRFAQEFRANTEPSARYEGKQGMDANNDKRVDLGCLPPGAYAYRKSTSNKFGNVLRPAGDIIVVRDVNHDGMFTEEDGKLVVVTSRMNSFRTMLFHKGGTSITGSAGCQTFPPEEFPRFWKSLGGQDAFQYVLVTVA